MMKKNITYFLLFGFFVLFRFSLIAQNPDIKRTYHWYFGNQAGVDFSNGSPMAVTNGQMNVAGNPVSMSDTAGNLLFYSNRYNVWNKNHQVMPNGTGLIGSGGTNSFSNALCVPQPGNNNIYYIFYWEYDTINPSTDWNMCYAIVDMTLDGGLGDVISKQNFLMNKPTDGMASVKHADGNDIWIMNLKMNTDTFYTFLLTNTGLSTIPVKSIGGISKWVNNLKFSPDGTKLAATFISSGPVILDFDKSTGISSNPIIFPVVNNNSYSFGVEFSEDNQKLYTTYWFEVTPGVTWSNAVYQIDLTGTSSQIINSKILLDSLVISDSAATSYIDDFAFGLQLAPDKKIYVAKNTRQKFAAITNPNILGLGCNYIDSAIYLIGRNCAWGLPSFISNYFFDSTLISVTNIPELSDNIICYPNPFNYTTNIIIPSPLTISYIEIFDLFGRKTDIKKKSTKENAQTIITIERNNLPAGIYILSIKTNKKTYSQKLIITN